jgi:hypothetical protein
MSQLQQELLDDLENLIAEGNGSIRVALPSGRKVLISVHALPISEPISRMDNYPTYEDD